MHVATCPHLCSKHPAGEDVIKRPLHSAQMFCVPQALQAQVLEAAATRTSSSKPCKPSLPANELPRLAVRVGNMITTTPFTH